MGRSRARLIPLDRFADVVEDHGELVGRNRPADVALDVGKKALRRLDAGARRRADMKPHLACVVDGREEVPWPSKGVSVSESPATARKANAKRRRRASAPASVRP